MAATLSTYGNRADVECPAHVRCNVRLPMAPLLHAIPHSIMTGATTFPVRMAKLFTPNLWIEEMALSGLGGPDKLLRRFFENVTFERTSSCYIGSLLITSKDNTASKVKRAL